MTNQDLRAQILALSSMRKKLQRNNQLDVAEFFSKYDDVLVSIVNSAIIGEASQEAAHASTGTLSFAFDNIVGKLYAQVSQTGNITIDVDNSGSLRGASIRLEIVGNGSNTLSFTGSKFNMLNSSFDNSIGVVNVIWMTYVGTDDVDVTIAQL